MKAIKKNNTLFVFCIVIMMSCNPEKNTADGPVYNDNKPSSSEIKDEVGNGHIADSLKADSLKR